MSGTDQARTQARATPDCNRRGAEVRPGFFACDSNRLLHPEPGVVAIATCGICPYRNAPDRTVASHTPLPPPDPRFTTPCSRRGDVLERGVCNACGLQGKPFEVFACPLHGRCQTRRFRNDRPDLAVCLACDDFLPAAVPVPVPTV
jgi:hypothetical protein